MFSKVALLLTLTSLKGVGDLQALSVAFSCLDFAQGDVRVILHHRPDYITKVPSAAPQSVTLQAFFPPPHETLQKESLHLLCPVRSSEMSTAQASDIDPLSFWYALLVKIEIMRSPRSICCIGLQMLSTYPMRCMDWLRL